MVTSKSVGEGNNRYIICDFTKKYLTFIYEKYYTEPESDSEEIVIEDAVLKCRKMIFNAQLNMIKEQFGDLFEEYIKSI